MRIQTIGALLLFASAGPALATTPSQCKEVTFKVSGSAMNRNVTNVHFRNETALMAALVADNFPLIPVSGSQTLAGTYCAPLVKNNNNSKLQVLFHSITSNRDSWSALGGTSLGYPQYHPEIYSYVGFMNAIGYPTLAMDRLGNGKSSHPDPVLVVQGPYEDVLYHDLATQIRAGTTGRLPSAFSTLFWVGNSYGSELGTSSAQKYPNDFDAYVLTGFSKSVLPSLPGIFLQGPMPAATVDPARFGSLPLGYATSPVQQTRTNSFFGSPSVVGFDPEAATLFFTREDVVSFGQFISVYVLPVEAPQYKGRVLVLTGEEDQAFCGPGSSDLSPPAMCGSLLVQTKSLFPAADYNWQSVPKTGHAVQFHYSAPFSYGVAAAFLAGGKFAGGPSAY